MEHLEKRIEGFERYIIFDDGVIYDTKKQRRIKTRSHNLRYCICRLCDSKGQAHVKYLHRLLATAFIDNPDNLPQVNHIDGNKLNNTLDNLEWVTPSENTIHARENGLYRFKSHSYKVNVFNKEGIYLKTYNSVTKLCEDLNLNRKTVSHILSGERTNIYNYKFEYAEEGASTIESIA